jgi:lipopolysaccharide transport system permease protein
VLLQLLFWITPIVYPVEILPKNMSQIINLNPITPLMIAYHDIYVNHIWPEWRTLIYPFIIGISFCAIGLRLYRKKIGDMVDEL